jgi:5-amino-6-(5-phosphoribosylamino)uracil reductase
MKIVNVMATSVDGAIASCPGELDQERKKFGFQSDADHKHVIAQLSDADAVITGAESVRASSGALVAPNSNGRLPIWAILTNSGFADDAAIYQQDELEKWLISQEQLVLPELPNLVNLNYQEENPATYIVDRLKAKKCEKVLLFGGSTINRMFYEAGLVDELILTICPVIFASKQAVPLVEPELGSPVQLSLQTSHLTENLVFLKYTVNPNTQLS